MITADNIKSSWVIWCMVASIIGVALYVNDIKAQAQTAVDSVDDHEPRLRTVETNQVVILKDVEYIREDVTGIKEDLADYIEEDRQTKRNQENLLQRIAEQLEK